MIDIVARVMLDNIEENEIEVVGNSMLPVINNGDRGTLQKQLEMLQEEEEAYIRLLIDSILDTPKITGVDDGVKTSFMFAAKRNVKAFEELEIDSEYQSVTPIGNNFDDNIKIITNGFEIKAWNEPPTELACLLEKTHISNPYSWVFCKSASIEIYSSKRTKYVLYMLDYYGFERKFKIGFGNYGSNELLHEEIVEFTNSGVKISFSVKGHIVINFDNMSNAFGAVYALYAEADI